MSQLIVMPLVEDEKKEVRLGKLESMYKASMMASKKMYVAALVSLHEIHKKKLYKLKSSSFREYLEHEWGFGRKSMVYAHLSIIEPYYKLIENENEEFPDFERLKAGFQIASTSQEMAETIYEKAKGLPDVAFKDEVTELMGKIPTDSCDHESTTVKSVKICDTCGKFVPQGD